MAVFSPMRTALISGGASGIGLAVAQFCRQAGMKVAIADNNSESLSKAKDVLGSEYVETYETDVGDVGAWRELKTKVEGKFGEVDFLHLNAGVGIKGTWGDEDYFQKRPVSAPPSAIVLTGSKQGITNPPGNAAYNASKSAVKTLAEQLCYDLRSTSTSVHLLVPGWTFTGMTGGGGLKEKPAGAWEPIQVAEFMFKKMMEKKFYIICPDNDVTEVKDKKRMLWGVGDILYERPPLTRWRDEYKQEHEEWMSKTEI